MSGGITRKISGALLVILQGLHCETPAWTGLGLRIEA